MSFPSRSLLDYSERIRRLYEIISHRNTGPRSSIAKKMHVSVRSVSNYILVLRSLGADIEYDPIAQTYYFANGFTLTATLNVVIQKK